MFHRFFFTVNHSRSSLQLRMPRVTRGRSEIGGGRGSGVSLLAGPCGGGVRTLRRGAGLCAGGTGRPRDSGFPAPRTRPLSACCLEPRGASKRKSAGARPRDSTSRPRPGGLASGELRWGFQPRVPGRVRLLGRPRPGVCTRCPGGRFRGASHSRGPSSSPRPPRRGRLGPRERDPGAGGRTGSAVAETPAAPELRGLRPPPFPLSEGPAAPAGVRAGQTP